jgi:hypothetical protein
MVATRRERINPCDGASHCVHGSQRVAGRRAATRGRMRPVVARDRPSLGHGPALRNAPHMRTGMTIGGMLGWMASLAVACNGAGGVGAPCETKDDCEGELICDEHEGQGSCQEPHDHEHEETDTDTEHTSESGSETAHGHDSGSGTDHGHDSGSTSPATDSGSETSAATSTGEATTTGGTAAECEAYCGCMATNCSEYAAYPYADEAACLDACAMLTPDALTCFTAFCGDAEVEHQCEHAWGELGTDKC